MKLKANKVSESKVLNDQNTSSISFIRNIELYGRSVTNNIIQTIYNYKKTSIFLVLVASTSYYFYWKYFRDYYLIYKELQKINSDTTNSQSKGQDQTISDKFLPTFTKVIIKVIQQVEIIIQKNFSLDSNYNEIIRKDIQRSIEEKTHLWLSFKSKLFISTTTAMLICRPYIILIQLNLILLERIKNSSQNSYSSFFYENVNNELWNLILESINKNIKEVEHSLFSIEKKNGLDLKSSYSKDNVINLFKVMRDQVEEIEHTGDSIRLKILDWFLESIKNKISEYEKKELNFLSNETNENMFGVIKYFKEYHDICSSSLTAIMICKGIDNDFVILEDIINENFKESIKLPCLKIISFIYNIKCEMMTSNNSFYSVQKWKDSTFYSDIDKFFKFIYEN